MLHKTNGIVFRLTNYGETSVIVNVFTGSFGLQSYIVNGVRGKTKTQIALYQPLTLLEMVVYHRENASIMRIKDVKCIHPYQTLNLDFRKSTIALFLNEVTNRTIKEQSHAQELCEFLIQSFICLDSLQHNIENFHLIFLIRLSQYLGFRPSEVAELSGGWMADKQEEVILSKLLTANYNDTIAITLTQRKNILDMLLRFYVLHSENFGELKSLAVVREIIQ